MASRWYSTVIDSLGTGVQARWWAEVEGWHLMHESPQEDASADPDGDEYSLVASGDS